MDGIITSTIHNQTQSLLAFREGLLSLASLPICISPFDCLKQRCGKTLQAGFENKILAALLYKLHCPLLWESSRYQNDWSVISFPSKDFHYVERIKLRQSEIGEDNVPSDSSDLRNQIAFGVHTLGDELQLLDPQLALDERCVVNVVLHQ